MTFQSTNAHSDFVMYMVMAMVMTMMISVVKTMVITMVTTMVMTIVMTMVRSRYMVKLVCISVRRWTLGHEHIFLKQSLLYVVLAE